MHKTDINARLNKKKFLPPKAMAYQLYRNTTLGNSLQESLDELIQSQQITPQLALQVLLQFDKAINSALAQRVRNRVNFRVRIFFPKPISLNQWLLQQCFLGPLHIYQS
uniref:Transcription initiation factor IIA gamma chain n=1 Tax=Myotis myotis TaxID=51298 RepID=A0A7J8AM79_MYOMY|nr:hypothetical protein mMyoMyo1_008110 [Myotis myotis]